jgi:hypothetical protein
LSASRNKFETTEITIELIAEGGLTVAKITVRSTGERAERDYYDSCKRCDQVERPKPTSGRRSTRELAGYLGLVLASLCVGLVIPVVISSTVINASFALAAAAILAIGLPASLQLIGRIARAGCSSS